MKLMYFIYIYSEKTKMEFIISLIMDLCIDKDSHETIEKEIKYFKGATKV